MNQASRVEKSNLLDMHLGDKGDTVHCVIPARSECTSQVSKTATVEERTGISIQLRVIDVSQRAQVENLVLELWMGTQQRPELLASIVGEQIGGLGNEMNQPRLEVIAIGLLELGVTGESKRSDLKQGLALVELRVTVPGDLELECNSVNQIH